MRRTSSEKKGLVMSATTIPIRRVDCIRKPCATLDGAKPICATASCTRALSGALTKLVPLITFETVAVDTRARRATSLIVGFGTVRLAVRKLERALDGYRPADSLTAFSTKIKMPFRRQTAARTMGSVAIAFVFVLVGGCSVAGLYRNDLGQRGLVQFIAFDELGRGFHGDLSLLLRVLRDQGVDAAVLERADLGARRIVS